MTTDIFADMEQDAKEAPALNTDQTISTLASLAQRQVALEDEIADLERRTKEAKADLFKIQHGELPDAMREAGVANLTMADGGEVDVTNFVSANITKENEPKAHSWMMENGHGDLIKRQIGVNVGTDSNKAGMIIDALHALQLDLPVNDKATVHGSTLKKFVREQVAEGVPIPLKLFGAFVGHKSTIKRK
jgi:hypothetical protein